MFFNRLMEKLCNFVLCKHDMTQDNKKVQLGDKSFRPFIPYNELSEAIDNVAEKINNDYRGCTDVPVLLCVLNGAIMFTAELMKRLDFNCELVSLKLSSYEGTQSTGEVRQIMGLSGSVEGKRVLIAEDIVDTGTTITNLTKLLKEKGATEVKVCTMLLKPDVYKSDIKLDYVAKKIPNDFIVGFGLDYNEIGRNLKDIYVLDE